MIKGKAKSWKVSAFLMSLIYFFMLATIFISGTIFKYHFTSALHYVANMFSNRLLCAIFFLL